MNSATSAPPCWPTSRWSRGACWRCGTVVTQRSLDQWFFRTSAYAQELLDDLERMTGWPDKVRTMQRNWIGRSEGAFVEFPVEGGAPSRIFTTRIDTIYGATFLALSPDHPARRRADGRLASGGGRTPLHR